MKKTLLQLFAALLPLGGFAQAPAEPNLTVDYMVVYDNSSENYVTENGGEQKFAQDIVDVINLSLKNSNIDYRFRLAGTHHMNMRVGSINEGMSLAMNDPGVQEARQKMKADIVVLISDPIYDGLEGISNNHADRFAAFSSVRARAAIKTYTAVHEAGHVLGCYHSRTATDQAPSQHPWAAAWADANFRTVVSNPLSSEGKQVPIFSGPESVWVENGKKYVLGDATHDNVRMLRQTLPEAVWFGDYLDPTRYFAAEEQITLDHQAQSHEVKVYSGSFFKIDAERVSWMSELEEVKTQPLNGFYLQDGVFRFTVQPNTTGKDRSTKLRIYGDSDKADLTITITQKAESADTGIGEAEVETQKEDFIYDIQGLRQHQELQNCPKGLYIVNGKKVIRR